MKDDFSSSESQKSGSWSTPFDQIKHHEEQEAARVERERNVFERERQDVRRSAQEEEERAEQEERNRAMEELRAFREQGVQGILASGEERAAKAAQALREEYARNAPAVVKDLVTTALSPASPFLSS